MNLDQISQIVESIKTLNINFNDATTQKIADAILPVVKMYIIKDYFSMFLIFAGILIGIGMIIHIIKWCIKRIAEDEETIAKLRKETEEARFKN